MSEHGYLRGDYHFGLDIFEPTKNEDSILVQSVLKRVTHPESDFDVAAIAVGVEYERKGETLYRSVSVGDDWRFPLEDVVVVVEYRLYHKEEEAEAVASRVRDHNDAETLKKLTAEREALRVKQAVLDAQIAETEGRINDLNIT